MTGPEQTEGGDPVCWLGRVCDACGALTDGPAPPVCERCGTPRDTSPVPEAPGQP